jgi:ATP-binding cassette subfamily B protein RaxB
VRALRLTHIIVAHRPETIASADRVIELRDGRVLRDERRTPRPEPGSAPA